MMVTYAEQITILRGEREQLSLEMERLRIRRRLINVQLLALEQAITPPKVAAKAKPGDVIMTMEPGEPVVLKGGRNEG